jgi:hypothetical protein
MPSRARWTICSAPTSPRTQRPQARRRQRVSQTEAEPGSADALFAEEPQQTAKAFGGAPDGLLREQARVHLRPARSTGRSRRNTLELSLDGGVNGMNWKVSGRAVWDPVFRLRGLLSPRGRGRPAVRDEHTRDLRRHLARRPRFPHRAPAHHLGRDGRALLRRRGFGQGQREFVLQEFDILRIPQWAARAEYFKDDLHAELVWIPYMTYNEVGKPGAEFFDVELPESFPEDGLRFVQDQPAGLDDGAYGARSHLPREWLGPVGVLLQQPRCAAGLRAHDQTSIRSRCSRSREVHERIDQAGATLAKDFGGFVLKAETIYTSGRRSASRTPRTPTGCSSRICSITWWAWNGPLPTKGASTCSFSSAGFPTTTTHDDLRRPGERH